MGWTPDFPLSAATLVDVDGDGTLDLVGLYGYSGVGVQLNQGGSFAPAVVYDASLGQTGVAVGDVNGDGRPDIVTVGNGPDQVTVLLNTGGGAFGTPATYPFGQGFLTAPTPAAVALGDMNGDGVLDVVVAIPAIVFPTNENEILLNVMLSTGTGALGAPAAYTVQASLYDRPTVTPSSLAVADVNGDGKPDVAVGGDTQISVLLNKGKGVLGAPTNYGAPGLAVVLVDVNGDHKPDLVAMNATGATVQFNAGNGTFDPLTQYPEYTVEKASSLSVADVNGDGSPDLVIGGDYLSVLLGTGSGTFGAQVDYTVTGPAITGDVDGDGKPDVVTGWGVLKNHGNGTFDEAVAFSVASQSFWIGDLNGDGVPDLVVENGPTNNNYLGVLLGTGGGHFAPEVDYAVHAPYAVQLADLNGDGKPDIIVSELTAPAANVLLNHGDGTFAPPVTYGLPGFAEIIAVSDLNGDGLPDLAISYDTSTSTTTTLGVEVLLNTGGGAFGVPVNEVVYDGPFLTYEGSDLAVADLDGDGLPDLAVAQTGSNAISVLLNTGGGTFAAPVEHPTAGMPAALSTHDLNGDGLPDLVFDDDNVGVMLNTGGGTFAAEVDYAGGGYTVADVNHDGSPDLLLLSTTTVTVQLNHGDGTFAAPITAYTSTTAGAVRVGDMNGDGLPDLVTEWGNSLSVWLGHGDGTFGQSSGYPSGPSAVVVALADMNGDGRLDVVLETSPTDMAVLLNVCLP